jgi:hypothetical protein
MVGLEYECPLAHRFFLSPEIYSKLPGLAIKVLSNSVTKLNVQLTKRTPERKITDGLFISRSLPFQKR